MATTFNRLRESLAHISHWCSGRGTKIIVIIVDWEDRYREISSLLEEFHRQEIQATFFKPFNESHTTSQSHFMVLTHMPLSDALAKLDHTREMYVGGLAEDFGSIKNFGLMAYGGAGAYLSAPLARKLADLEQATECIQETPPDFGDVIVRDCVYHHSKTKLTWLPGLYQHDLTGDLSGFFESGVEPLNLHHWNSWYKEPVTKMAATTEFCGGCFLQRWRFGKDTVFSNGYSIVKYRHGLENLDLNKMEHTFGAVYGDVDPQYDFTIGPLRDRSCKPRGCNIPSDPLSPYHENNEQKVIREQHSAEYTRNDYSVTPAQNPVENAETESEAHDLFPDVHRDEHFGRIRVIRVNRICQSEAEEEIATPRRQGSPEVVPYPVEIELGGKSVNY
ncbi:hypothetical protein DL767_000619 [Monosporascus sp. MG133]|nr:hypothetical protein DL767_000619 [Monosporascus sp. MG133]